MLKGDMLKGDAVALEGDVKGFNGNEALKAMRMH